MMDPLRIAHCSSAVGFAAAAFAGATLLKAKHSDESPDARYKLAGSLLILAGVAGAAWAWSAR